ncbi:hypothetical protein SK128_019126 [Halocaridina rubra]|uniref:Uncharacterized protein n=1 Tax=Halocaridina rubra TaxID=373956 RepID=A0AAN8WJJ5_HALRR
MDYFFGNLGLGSEYGGSSVSYGDSGGYEKSIDCNAALGLLGLLGFIELLRDIIEDLTAEEEDAGARRRRSFRVHDDVFKSVYSSSAVLLGDTGGHNLKEILPSVIIPLLVSALFVDGF